MTHSDRDGSENAARELGKIAAQIAGFAAPAGPPLHESADRDADNVPSDRVRAYAEALRNPGTFVDRLTVTDAYPDGRDSRELLVDWQARACVAVEERHTAELRAEVERLREGYAVRDERIGRLEREVHDMRRDLAHAGRDFGDLMVGRKPWLPGSVREATFALGLLARRGRKAEATIARVEALADLWISREGWFDPSMDTQTHLIADRVYAQVGKRLRAALRPEPAEATSNEDAPGLDVGADAPTPVGAEQTDGAPKGCPMCDGEPKRFAWSAGEWMRMCRKHESTCFTALEPTDAS